MNYLFENELFLITQQLQQSKEALTKHENLLADYEQQIKQLNKQLAVANELQQLQAESIEFLQNKLKHIHAVDF